VSVYCFSLAPQDSVSEGAFLSSDIFSAGPSLLQGGHSIVCGDIVSPTTLSREVFAIALLFVSMVLRNSRMHLYLLLQCSRCWYRFAKSAMDFFGCCMPTKNSLTVQDSVIFFFLVDVALAPSLLYSFYKVPRAPLRSVEY